MTVTQITGRSSDRVNVRNSLLSESDPSVSDEVKPTLRVSGKTLTWPPDGWYEVQHSQSYNTVSEGGRSATLEPGTYNVINYTTGERFENVVVHVGSSNQTVADQLRDSPTTVERLVNALSNQSDVYGLATPITYPPGLPTLSPTQVMYEHVTAEDVQNITAGVSVKNAQFTDGQRAALLTLGTATVFVTQSPAGELGFHRVQAGELGPELIAGESFSTVTPLFEDADITVTVSPDGQSLSTSVFQPSFSFSNVQVNLDGPSGNMHVTANHSGFGLPGSSQDINTSLWEQADLVNVGSAIGTDPSDAEQYDFYRNTAEGQAIATREFSYYNNFDVDGPSSSATDQRLFVARVKYNRGEGGTELFSEFMPNRTALLGQPAELASYDAQLELVLDHVMSDSKVSEDGKPLDPSLQFIVASGLTEVIGHNPDLVGRVLADLNRGWRIELEHDEGGTYTWEKPLFQSVKSKIHYQLDRLLISYSNPDDLYELVGHEIAHSLDGYRTTGLDGIPSRIASSDKTILLEERSRLFTTYRETGYTSGLAEYAYTNNKEFWAELSEFFLSGSDGATLIRTVSPELYGVLSRFYALTY